MNAPITLECEVHFRRAGRGRRTLEPGQTPRELSHTSGRVPRVARLMALALRFEEYLKTGAVADYAELAVLGHVTRARITQIMNLLLLAPDLQEALLFLPKIMQGRDQIVLRHLQPIALEMDWRRQRNLWKQLLERQSVATA